MYDPHHHTYSIVPQPISHLHHYNDGRRFHYPLNHYNATLGTLSQTTIASSFQNYLVFWSGLKLEFSIPCGWDSIVHRSTIGCEREKRWLIFHDSGRSWWADVKRIEKEQRERRDNALEFWKNNLCIWLLKWEARKKKKSLCVILLCRPKSHAHKLMNLFPVQWANVENLSGNLQK